MSGLRNWAGNQQYAAAGVHYPTTVDQIQDLVIRHSTLKVLGTRHSFNHVADTSGQFLSLRDLDRVVALDLDPERPRVTVEGCITYGQLCRFLQSEGYALRNLASLPHISIAGACATATHGSGKVNSNLATSVCALEIVIADGSVVNVTREQDGDTFAGMVVGLGALGVVTKLTLDLIPAFDARQEVYENLPLAQLKDHFDEIELSAYSVSLFTDWHDANFNQIWFKRRVTVAASFDLNLEQYGATRATRPLHPIASLSAVNCTEQMGIPGPWYERLPHFRMDHQPSSGEELQSEYFVPYDRAAEALDAIYRLREHVAPLLQISEVRTIAADNLWMSPCYEQPCVAIHFTWLKNWPAVREVLPLIERELAPLNARPHWGKLFTMPPAQLQPLYARLSDFRQLLHRFDPDGKFRNDFLDTYIVGAL